MLKGNLIANYLGQGWTALMGLAFVPVYIKYLGIESYGLIGLFAVLQAWLNLLDLGMAPTLSREMGRFTAGTRTNESIADLLRSVETLAVLIAVLTALGVASGSMWLATNWLRAEQLPVTTVAQAFTMMGVVTALQFVIGLYRSSLIGLQKQVLLNLVNCIMATFRSVGAVAVLIWVSPTISAFFIWQGVASLLTLILFMRSTYTSLNGLGLVAVRAGRFSIEALRSVRKYAGGVLWITFLALLLTQVDKVLLSRLLTLSEFGYYTLGAVVAGGLYVLVGPIMQAWFPRLSQLHAANLDSEFIEAYHQGAQLVTVIVGSATLVLVMYSEIILRLWTQDEELARSTADLVKWLAVGNLLNGLLTMPYQAQLALGWTGFAIRVNTIAVVAIVPAILWAVPIYGMMGAAYVWVLLNTGYMLLGMHFMYRRILKTEKWRWYREDILLPMLSATAMAVLLVEVLPVSGSAVYQFSAIAMSGLLILAAAIMGAPRLLKRVWEVVYGGR